ncbi:MAG: dienelactone hydrolase [Pseudomonadota bacterium]
MKWIRRVLLGLLVLAGVVVGVFVSTALRSERPVGFQLTQTTGPDGTPFAIGVWYPSDARPLPTTLVGAILMSVARDGPIAGNKLPLVVISHGNGGGPMGHADLAMALASAGYVVAAPMHPGDNVDDQSAVGTPSFFTARTGQLHATVDHMLARWPGHARIDAERVGAYGFSMGGFTVLTALGARPDLHLIASHCTKTAEFACDVLRHFKSPLLNANAATAGAAFVPDPRIKAAVLAAPGLGFTMGTHGLDQVHVPVQLWAAEKDENVTSPGPVREALDAKVDFHLVPGASHYAFLVPCGVLLRPAGICTDLGDFDRKAFHQGMNASVLAFFGKHLKGATRPSS